MSTFFGQAVTAPIPAGVEKTIDDASALAGFRHREPLKAPPKRRRGTSDQLHTFTMKVAIDDCEKFIRWCESERLAYREGFARLVAGL